MNFDTAFAKLLGNEGGYSNDPRDSGGETKFGISKRSYPGEDIANMTVERAKLIYQRDYWGPAGCDAVPDALKFHLFDAAVNSGIKPAIKMLQLAVHETTDGILGPMTLQAVQSMDAMRLVARFTGQRLMYLTALGSWDSFGKGWTRRLASNLMGA